MNQSCAKVEVDQTNFSEDLTHFFDRLLINKLIKKKHICFFRIKLLLSVIELYVLNQAQGPIINVLEIFYRLEQIKSPAIKSLRNINNNITVTFLLSVNNSDNIKQQRKC